MPGPKTNIAQLDYEAVEALRSQFGLSITAAAKRRAEFRHTRTGTVITNYYRRKGPTKAKEDPLLQAKRSLEQALGDLNADEAQAKAIAQSSQDRYKVLRKESSLKRAKLKRMIKSIES